MTPAFNQARMWLEIVSAPDIVDGGLANPLALSHGPATPVRHPRRFGLQGCIYDTGDLVDWIHGLSSAPWSDVPQTVQALLAEALPPENHRVSIHRKPLRNGDIGLSRSGGQNDTATQSDLLWCALSSGPLLEFHLLNFGKLTRLAHSPG